jgi:alpha-L-fucosidase
VFQWPTDGRLVVPGLKNKVRKSHLLADCGRTALAVTGGPDGQIITIPKQATDPIDTVVVLDIEGTPNVVASH